MQDEKNQQSYYNKINRHIIDIGPCSVPKTIILIVGNVIIMIHLSSPLVIEEHKRLNAIPQSDNRIQNSMERDTQFVLKLFLCHGGQGGG